MRLQPLGVKVIHLVLLNILAIMGLSFNTGTYALQKESEQINATIKQQLPNTAVGILVQDAKTGDTLYEHRSNEPFVPASLTKLLTSTAALYELGTEFHYETTLAKDKEGNIYLQFTGDPSFKDSDLKALIQNLKTQNIQEIKGNLIIDNTRFELPQYGWGWSWNSLCWGFSAPVTAVMINENQIKVNITPGKVIGEKATLSLAPDETLIVPITDDVMTVSEYDAEETCQIILDMNDNNQVNARGCWPVKTYAAAKAETDKKETEVVAETEAKPTTESAKMEAPKPEFDVLKLAIRNPDQLLKSLVVKLLAEEQINLKGQIMFGRIPPGTENVYKHSSGNLLALLGPVLRDSNNLYSDSLMKTLGYARSQRGTFHAGIRAIQASLQEHTKLEPKQYSLWDGSGLSSYNFVTPQQFATVLQTIYQHKEFYPLINELLAHSGETGTLQERINNPELKGKIRAKTGSKRGIASLAGYLTTKSNRELIFVIMTEQAVGDRSNLSQFEKEICGILFNIE